jgi:hypothetical protein
MRVEDYNEAEGGMVGRIQDVCVCVRVQRPASSYKIQTEGNHYLEMGNETYQGRFIGLCHSAVEVFPLLRHYVGSLFVTNSRYATSQKGETSKITKIKHTVHRSL